DDVPDRGVLAPGAAEHFDAENLSGAAVVRHVEHAFRLDHGLPFAGACSRQLTADERLIRPLLSSEDGLHGPPLVVRQGPRLDDPHPVSDAALLLLVVRLVARALL